MNALSADCASGVCAAAPDNSEILGTVEYYVGMLPHMPDESSIFRDVGVRDLNLVPVRMLPALFCFCIKSTGGDLSSSKFLHIRFEHPIFCSKQLRRKQERSFDAARIRDLGRAEQDLVNNLPLAGACQCRTRSTRSVERNGVCLERVERLEQIY